MPLCSIPSTRGTRAERSWFHLWNLRRFVVLSRWNEPPVVRPYHWRSSRMPRREVGGAPARRVSGSEVQPGNGRRDRTKGRLLSPVPGVPQPRGIRPRDRVPEIHAVPPDAGHDRSPGLDIGQVGRGIGHEPGRDAFGGGLRSAGTRPHSDPQSPQPADGVASQPDAPVRRGASGLDSRTSLEPRPPHSPQTRREVDLEASTGRRGELPLPPI